MGNLASRLAVQVTLASTNSYLEQIKNNIVSFLDDVAPYVYVTCSHRFSFYLWL